MKKLRIAAIVFLVIALIGAARYFGGVSPVNAGIFLFPGIIAAVLFVLSRKREA